MSKLDTKHHKTGSKHGANKAISHQPLKIKVGSNPHTKPAHKANTAMFSSPLHGKGK